MVLAGHTPGRITVLDLSEKFIGMLNQNAEKRALQGRVRGIVGSMDDLPFGEESLDLIWLEGANCYSGLERGLSAWWEEVILRTILCPEASEGVPISRRRMQQPFARRGFGLHDLLCKS